MMDLSVETEAIGLPVSCPINESPTVSGHPVKSPADLDAFRIVDLLHDARVRTFEATMRRMAGLDLLKEAYVIGPFTLAGLMMGATEVAVATLEAKELVHAAAAYATEVIIPHAKALVAAGAEIICILEPTATFISPPAYKRFSGAYVRQIMDARHATPEDPMTLLHVCGNTKHLVKALCETGVQGLSLDAPMDMVAAIEAMPEDVVLASNVDPVSVMVQSSPDQVASATRGLLEAMAPYPNFILSTGCDLPPETPPANIDAFMRAGRGGQVCI